MDPIRRFMAPNLEFMDSIRAFMDSLLGFIAPNLEFMAAILGFMASNLGFMASILRFMAPIRGLSGSAGGSRASFRFRGARVPGREPRAGHRGRPSGAPEATVLASHAH